MLRVNTRTRSTDNVSSKRTPNHSKTATPPPRMKDCKIVSDKAIVRMAEKVSGVRRKSQGSCGVRGFQEGHAAKEPNGELQKGQPRTALDATYGRELCVRSIRNQPNGFHSKISFGSTVSAAKRAINIADAINTPK